MKSRRTMFAWMAFLFFLPLAAHSQKVTVDWDHSLQSFTTFKTYAWVKPLRPTSSPLMDQRIVAAIDDQLSAKGLQKVEGTADILVTYNAGLRQERSASAMGMGRFRMGGGMATINQNIANIGTLVVDISGGRTRALIWRGTAEDTLSGQPDKNSKKINTAVAKMFKKYPPPTK